MAGTIRGLDSAGGGTLPDAAIEDLATNIETAGTRIRGAVDGATASKVGIQAAPAIVRTHNALSRVVTEPVDMLHVGDSITEGAHASGIGKRWVDLVREHARAKYQPIGVPGGPAFVKGYHTYQGTQPYAWTRSAGVEKRTGVGRYIGGQAMLVKAGESVTLTFTGTAVRVYFANYNSGGATLTVTIDGAAAAGLGPMSSSFEKIDSVMYDGLTAGEHTIVLTHGATAGTASFYVNGAYVYNGDETNGIRAWETALSGARAPGSADREWFGKSVRELSPDVATVYYGTNEYAQNIAVATFETNLAGVVDAVLDNMRPRPAVALLQGYRPAHSGTPVAQWEDYRAAVARVAEATGVVLVDLEGPFGGPGTITAGLLNADGVHPTDAGHQVIADAVIRALAL